MQSWVGLLKIFNIVACIAYVTMLCTGGNFVNLVGLVVFFAPLLISVILFALSATRPAAEASITIVHFIFWSGIGLYAASLYVNSVLYDAKKLKEENEWSAFVDKKQVELRKLPAKFYDAAQPNYMITDGRNPGYLVLIEFDHRNTADSPLKDIIVTPVGLISGKELRMPDFKNRDLLSTLRNAQRKNIFETYLTRLDSTLEEREFETNAYSFKKANWYYNTKQTPPSDNAYRLYRWSILISGVKVESVDISFFNDEKEVTLQTIDGKLQQRFSEAISSDRRMGMPKRIVIEWNNSKEAGTGQCILDFAEDLIFDKFNKVSLDRSDPKEKLILPITVNGHQDCTLGDLVNVGLKK